MKIRKKTAKPAAAKPPLYIIGYSFSAPSADELKIWYDLEYGGPLKLDPEGQGGWFSALHGPWRAWIKITLPPAEADVITQGMPWEHRTAGTVAPAATGPNLITDTVLFAARLARGVTLLTQGTALDLVTQQYINPSDWQDRLLSSFDVRHHIDVQQRDGAGAGEDWFYTLGMSKFGLDELELMRPKGLPEAPALELLAQAAAEILATGRNPKVGSTLAIASLARSITVVKHRTAAAPLQRQHIFREIAIA
jgi:hypothetical protein